MDQAQIWSRDSRARFYRGQLAEVGMALKLGDEVIVFVVLIIFLVNFRFLLFFQLSFRFFWLDQFLPLYKQLVWYFFLLDDWIKNFSEYIRVFLY